VISCNGSGVLEIFYIMDTSPPKIRPAAVAGAFYPGDAESLSQMVAGFVSVDANRTKIPVPKAVIVPHAGYMYSGELAARALSRFTAAKDPITRIVLLGPCHRVPVRGLAAPLADFFSTPLGNVKIDRDAIDAVTSLPFVTVDDKAHAEEHSLEVQLPILQELLTDFMLVPLAVGDATIGQVAQVLETLWKGDETRIVISSDLSHFLTQDQAQHLDEKTALSIERLDWQSIEHEQACGRIPISGLLTIAKQRNLSCERIALLTSADTAGTPDQVVGYGAWAFS